MKNFKTFLEAKNTGAGEFGELETPQKPLKYGFIVNDENSGRIFGVHANNAAELEDALLPEDDGVYDKAFKLKVGESVKITDYGIWCRIW